MRADKELDEKWERWMILKDEYDDLVPFDLFRSWLSTYRMAYRGDILEDNLKYFINKKRRMINYFLLLQEKEFLNEGVKMFL